MELCRRLSDDFITSVKATILRMMDEEDGVMNRRTKSKSTKKKVDQRLLLHGESVDELD